MSYAGPVSVVKVGGSLLSLDDLSERLRAWMATLGNDQPVALLAGGGSLVDELRLMADRVAMSERDAHFHAIRLMSVTAALLAHALRWPVSNLEQASTALDAHRRIVVDASTDLIADDGQTLPAGWHVTSDSIAAWVACRLQASQLVLLKSVGDDETIDVGQATRMNWIDHHFPTALGDLAEIDCKVTWVNLRREPWKSVKLAW